MVTRYGIALYMDRWIDGWTGDVLMNFHFKNFARQDRDYISRRVIATSVFVLVYRSQPKDPISIPPMYPWLVLA